MRSALSKAIFVGLAIATTSIVSCSSDSNKGSHTAEAGSGTVGLQLTVAPGVTINAVTWSITQSGSTFTRTGTINVTNSQIVTEVIAALPAGTGYSITLNAASTDGVLTCVGNATFSVVARTTTPVTVNLTCQRPKNFGSILINGVLNVCPVIDSVSATAPMNGVVQLSSSASDIDSKPSALSYAWTVVPGGAGAGTLNAGTTNIPTFTCTAAGQVNFSLTVTDGDNSTNCPDTYTTSIICAVGTSTPDAGGAGGAGGSGGVDAGSDSSTAGSAGSGTAGSAGSATDAGPDATDAGADATDARAEAEAAPPACVPNAACLACEGDVNSGCPEFITGCDAFAGAQKASCLALVKCVRDSSCHSNNTLDCYCGTADATQCLATTGAIIANGACKAQIEAAQGTTNPTAIQNSYTDVANPGGAAMSLMLCDNAVCAAQCIPYGTTCP